MEKQSGTRLGFIGLGKMGASMAKNLIARGFSLAVNDISEDRLAELASIGAAVARDSRELASCPVIILCLPGNNQVREILTGGNGLLPLLNPGQTVLDMSTTTVSFAREMHALFAAKGVRLLDAPISGGLGGARDGTLTIMAGGERDTFDRALPYFSAMGKNILYMGGPGCGQLTKAVNNVLYNISMAALAEVVPIAIASGLDPKQITEVINSSTGRSFCSEFFLPRILRREFTGAYAMGSAYKDMINLGEIALYEAIPAPVIEAATLTYKTALRKGYGDQDKSAMMLLFEDLLNVKLAEK
ncbi:3-hydroxyisobutyrate dehydrogenase [uncultured delta proteobacterium]|uniref:3-hydroxyisobutyrate dehydrogenase n=1 Tax=uncultured delta proteobacterium TaxID=34034 RepID=A0A212IZ15_9DELT|nr:3-hydroxyisobutyrate dehydrogenase [uncultured delta proteobacterium]